MREREVSWLVWKKLFLVHEHPLFACSGVSVHFKNFLCLWRKETKNRFPKLLIVCDLRILGIWVSWDLGIWESVNLEFWESWNLVNLWILSSGNLEILWILSSGNLEILGICESWESWEGFVDRISFFVPFQQDSVHFITAELRKRKEVDSRTRNSNRKRFWIRCYPISRGGKCLIFNFCDVMTNFGIRRRFEIKLNSIHSDTGGLTVFLFPTICFPTSGTNVCTFHHPLGILWKLPFKNSIFSVVAEKERCRRIHSCGD